MTKPHQILNVQTAVEGARDAMASDRREFMRGLGVAVLTVQMLPLIARASEDPPSDGHEAGDNLVIQSGPGLFSHVHDLLVAWAILRTPPHQGVELTTTRALFHTHNIALTQKQLITVRQGGTVTAKSSSHFFVIALARQDRI
jgi:hypothetical protein